MRIFEGSNSVSLTDKDQQPEQEAPKDDWVNPIDPDKVAENPHTLPYAHPVSGPVIKPEDVGKRKGRALSAMQQQTDLQFDQIRKQMELLAQQAKDLQDRVEISNRIYDAECPFEPLVGHTYYLYRKDNGIYVLSMIGPNEWGRSQKYPDYIATASLLADHTWNVIDSANED